MPYLVFGDKGEEIIDLGYLVGWVGVAFGLLVPLPQLRKIIKTRSLNDIALGTYIFLCVALTCYLIHAIYIGSIVLCIIFASYYQVLFIPPYDIILGEVLLCSIMKNTNNHPK